MRLEISDRLTQARPAQPGGYREAAGSGEIDLRIIPDFFRRRWRLIATVTALFLSLAVVYVWTATPIYVAYAQVLLEPKSEKALDQLLGKSGGSPDSALGSEFIETQIGLIETLRVMRRVVVAEKLDQDPEFNGTQKPKGITAVVFGTIGKVMSLFSTPKQGELAANDPLLIPSRILQSSVDVFRSGKAYVVLVSVRAKSPAKAARLANAVAQAYIDDRLSFRTDAAKRDTQWLSSRLQALSSELKASEDAVAAFRTKNNLITPRGSGSTVNEQQVVDLNTRLVAAQTETAEKLVKLQQAESVKAARGNADAIPDVLRSPVIMAMRQQEAELGRKEADLSSRYGAAYPQVVNVRAERANLRNSIQAEINRIVVTLRNDYQVAKAREDQLKESMKQLTGQTGVDEGVMVQLRELERTAAANKTLYEDFLSRSKLTDEQSSLDIKDARIINEAQIPFAPASPRSMLAVVLGLMSGLIFGVGLGIVLDLFNGGFTAPRQVEDLLDLPVLSSVFSVAGTKRSDGRPPSPAFLVAERPLSRYTESIRSVWTALRISQSETPQVVAVTSAFPREGKSTTSLSLALSALEFGNRVLLIDADLRRPSVGPSLGLPQRAGLSDLLGGTATIREAIAFDGKLGIGILPAGSETTNPSGLLSSARMKALVETLRHHYDVVIIDTPPLGPVTDAVMISQLVDKLVFVCAWSKTPREAVVSALRKLPNLRKVAGVVLTMVDDRKVSYAGQYGYYGLPQFKSYYKG